MKTNGTEIQYKLDTGSQVNIITEQLFNKLRKKPKIHKSKIKLTSYSGNSIPIKGTCVLTVNRKQKVFKLHFVVVSESRTPIIGVSACSKLGLVKRVYMVDKDQYSNSQEPKQKEVSTVPNLTESYKDVFEGLECLPGEHKIQLDETVPPVIHPCRKVPFALHNKLKQELDRMEKAEVICKVEQSSTWVSSIVLSIKKNGALRVCLDPRDLNKAIKREHFKLP